MRDEMEAEMWMAHHVAFSDWMIRAAIACIAGLRRLPRAWLARRSPRGDGADDRSSVA